MDKLKQAIDILESITIADVPVSACNELFKLIIPQLKTLHKEVLERQKLRIDENFYSRKLG